MNPSRFVLVAGALVTTLSVLACSSDQAPDAAADSGAFSTDPRTAVVMQHKLAHAHNILDALAVEGFETIARNADQLVDLSEQSDWFVHDTASYVALSERFRQATRELAARARAEDLPGVTEAYGAMMNECVACHQYLKAEGMYKDLPGRITWRDDGEPSTAVATERR